MESRLVVFCAVLGVAIAAVGLAKHEPKPEKYKDVEGCYIGKLDMVIPFGESRPSSKQCMEYRCGSKYVQLVSCGAVIVLPPLELVTDSEKPYPECCPKIGERIPPTENSTAVIDDKV